MSLDKKIIERINYLISKADETLASHSPNAPGVIGFPTLSPEQFIGWQTQCLSYLISLLGEGHTYVVSFREKVVKGFKGNVNAGKGILSSLKEDIIGGYLTDIKSLITAEVFTDFIEIAEHLLENDYKDPAASLLGAVLEDSLRKILEKANITVKTSDNLNSLNKRSADSGIYNRLIQRKIHVWISIRNSADHGNFDEYSYEDVVEMSKGVNNFLSDYL